jgi:NADPH-dependent ferric siderophore reductase
MSDQVPTFAGGDMTTADFLTRSPELRAWRLQVAEIVDATPLTRHVRLTAPDLAEFSYAPGQDLMVLVDTTGGRIIRRRYTIRRFDPASLLIELQMIVHTSGPGARWVRGLRVGDAVEAIGPRGKITLSPSADWHLLIGDDVAVPGMAAMVEALPATARAIVVAEVADVDERQPIDAAGAGVSWTWLHRDGRPANDAAVLLAAIQSLDLPAGRGHAYIAGEASVVAALRKLLLERGMAPESISAKAYWGSGRANASHGEPLASDRAGL